MRTPRSLFWMNNAKSGAENLCEVDDPRQTCIAMNAGEFKSDAEATRLGIMHYLYGGGSGPQAQSRGVRQEAPDPKATSEAAAKGTAEVHQAQVENPPLRGVSIEERSYVENAVGSGAPVSQTERAVAGQMHAEFTGPSPAEITAAGGSYQAAAEKAAQAQGVIDAPPPKADEGKPAESPATPTTPRPRT